MEMTDYHPLQVGAFAQDLGEIVVEATLHEILSGLGELFLVDLLNVCCKLEVGAGPVLAAGNAFPGPLVAMLVHTDGVSHNL